MNKQEIISFKIPIKSQKQILEFKKRQENHLQTTPKIILGKLIDNVQQIWTQQYTQQKISHLRELHSNDISYEIAIQIVNASDKLSKIYGNFILNQNMVFVTKTKKIFIWINPDIFLSSPKIYLPPGKDGQVSMVKSLINYLRLWLQTNYQIFTQIKSLQELSVNLQQLKKQRPPVLKKDNSSIGFSFGSSSKGSIQKMRLYESSKGIKIKKVNKDNYSKKNSKNSDTSSKNDKCFTNRCFTSQPLNNQKYLKNQIKIVGGSKASNNDQKSSGEKGSFTNSFSKQSSRSFRNLKRNPKQQQSKFPNKTTSSTLHIIQKIKQQDQNPDHYPANKILIEESQNQNSQKTSLMKSSLGGINQQMDNLFKSNIQSEQNQEEIIKREKQFQEILKI